MKATNKAIKNHQVFGKVLRAALDPGRPLLAQIVVTQRCNLSCSYCFEFDQVSQPVPFETLKTRIDHLKRLQVVFVTLNGGEPLLHPDAAKLVSYIGKLGMIPMINSNGHLLTLDLIHQLNSAALFGIQLSCDSLEDNDQTKKSLRRLLPVLQDLKKHAQFKVRVNAVLGSGPPKEIIEVAKQVIELGFDFQCSLMRDEKGATLPMEKQYLDAYEKIRNMQGRLPFSLHDSFQVPLIKGEELNWKCRSGARYFHLDPEGLVHLCQPRTGTPAKKLEDYTRNDILNFFYEHKECSLRCPHAYAHIGSRMDKFRRQNKA